MNSPRPRTQREISAGGLVLASHNPKLVALICHRNRGGGEDWVIPKGHQERGEDLVVTAMREVYEETGLEAEIVDKIGEISYSFRLGNTRVQKTVHHFLLQQTGGDLTHLGDPTGEVLQVGWFEITEIETILAHENEKKVALQALEMLS